MVASGSLVLKPVPSNTMVAGSPAKEIGLITGRSLPPPRAPLPLLLLIALRREGYISSIALIKTGSFWYEKSCKRAFSFFLQNLCSVLQALSPIIQGFHCFASVGIVCSQYFFWIAALIAQLRFETILTIPQAYGPKLESLLFVSDRGIPTPHTHSYIVVHIMRSL